MGMRTTLLVIVPSAACCGCLTGFSHALGPADEGFIEQQLIGTWACTSTDDLKPGVITIIDFDGKQYYIESTEPGKSEPSRTRAHAARIEGVPFLSAHEIGPNQDSEWTFLEYTVTDRDRLRLRMVDPQPFEDVIDDAAGVRQRLASSLQDPEVFLDLVSCTRAKGSK